MARWSGVKMRLQTPCYTPYFVVVWGAVCLSVPVVIAMAVLLVVFGVDVAGDAGQAEARIPAFAVCGALLVMGLLFTILMRSHGPRLLVRSAAWPGWCTGDAYPRRAEQLKKAVKEMTEGQDCGATRLPTVVGGGWGFFLQRHAAEAPRIYTHNMTGLMKKQEGDRGDRWRSGTTIAALVRHYENQDPSMTLNHHPTMDYISLGAWFSQGNHGNGGNTEAALHPPLIEGTVYDMMLQSDIEVDDVEILELVYNDPKRYCVLDVTLNPQALVLNSSAPDMLLQKECLQIFTDDRRLEQGLKNAFKWMSESDAGGSHLRLAFFGRARSYGMALRWTDQRVGEQAATKDENKRPYFLLCPCIPWRVRHVDPHHLQRLANFLQVDTFSAWGGCHESMYAFRGYTTWSNANRWVPPLFPIQTVFVALAGYKNFEPIFKLPSGKFGGFEFHDLAIRLQELHRKIGGRSEVRYGGESGVIYLDIAIRSARYREVFEMLREMKVTKVALHMGKYQVPVEPLKRVGLHALIGSKSRAPKRVAFNLA